MTLRIAFCGTGYINQIHARAAQAVPGVELVATVNHQESSLIQFTTEFGMKRRYTDLSDLLKDGDVDALVVGTPNYLHARQTIAALEAGLAVMVEKPMAMNAQEAEAMYAASQSSGHPLMVAHNWRFDPEVLWLRQQVEAGRLGRIVRTKGISSHVHWGPGGWFREKRYAGGGALVDMGIHAIDTARFLLGDPQPVSVYAQAGTHYAEMDVEDTAVLLITWSNGTISYIESGWRQPHADAQEAGTQLYGTAGFGQIFPTYLEMPKPGGSGIETIESGFPAVREAVCPQSMYDTQMSYFIDCVRKNKQPVPGGREGWINMCVLDAAYKSAQTGQVVQIQ